MKKRLLVSCISLMCWFSNAYSVGTVSFTASTTNGCAPLAVTFTNTSTTGNYYQWNFNDGTNVFTLNASHTFNYPRGFSVSLTAFDTTNHGMVMLGFYQMNIQVNGSSVNTTADSVCPGETFGASVYPNANSYSWNFGDGGTAGNQQNVTHVYSVANTYTMQVSISSGGCGTQNFSIPVVVKANVHPSAFFSRNGNGSCPNDPVQFYPRNQNANSYAWVFGDGSSQTSNQSQMSHSYSAPNKYPVKLTVTSSCGTSSTYIDTVNITGNIHFPSSSQIQSSLNQACPNDQISFNYNGVNALSYLWKFTSKDSSANQNPNFAFALAGTYTVTLKLHNGCGNDTTLSKIVQVKPNLPFQGNVQMQFYPNPVCPNDQVNFRASSANTLKWYFGDAAHDSSSLDRPSFSYPALGTYTVTLKLYNGCGRDTIITNPITVNNSNVPSISHSGNNGNWGSPSSSACPGDTVLFYAQVDGNLLWSFGDGTTTTHSTPIDGGNGTAYIVKHVYSTSNNFNVKLTVTNGCGNTASDSLSYTVGGSSPVNGSINILGKSNNNTYNACAALNLLGAGGSHYKWYFGNGDSIITTQAQISYKYKTAGSYTITLKVTNGCGNTGIYTKNITILGMSPSLASTNLLCNGAGSGQINASVSGGSQPYLFAINAGPYFSSGNFMNLAAGTYTITVKDSANCLVSQTTTLTQPTALALVPSSTNSSCGGSTGIASVAISGGTPAYTYSWQGGASTSSISSLHSGSYQVTVTDANACSINTSIAVNDNAGPVVTFSNTITPVCVNASSFALTGGSGTPSGGTGTYAGIGVSGGAFYNPAAAGAGTHTISYTYTQGGCTSSATNTITVNPLPHINIASSPANGQVCTGSSLTLTATGANTYTWNNSVNNGIAFTPASSGSYTVTGVDGNNCSSTANIAVTLNSIPVVSLSFTGHDTLGTCQSTVNLSGGSPAGGNYSGMDVSANAFSPSSAGAGTYTITYTYTNNTGCTASKSTALHVLPCPLFVPEQKANGFLKVYPNPSDGNMVVEVSEQSGLIEVMNLVGELIYSRKITQLTESLNLQSQPDGVYLIRVSSKNSSAVQRIVLVRP
jgi:PKD repeat protein